MIDFREVNRENNYYKIIQMSSKYNDGRCFPIDEIVIADKKVNLSADIPEDMGGFCVSDNNHIFRWIIRGDTLCQVKIPEDSKIYKTDSDNGIYIADKIILTNPQKIDDSLAMELYKQSKLIEISYFRALAACSIKGYSDTALKVFSDRINKQNVSVAIQEFDSFCKRREDEYGFKTFELESVITIQNKLKLLLNT